MPDDPSQPVPDPTDAAVERIIPPEQPPMDDAAGGPAASREQDADGDAIEEVSTDDLSVQGGD